MMVWSFVICSVWGSTIAVAVATVAGLELELLLEELLEELLVAELLVAELLLAGGS